MVSAMVRFQKPLLVVAMLLAVAGASACTAPLDQTNSSDLAGAVVQMLPDLPPVPVDFNEQGEIVKVGGLDLGQVNDLLSLVGVSMPTDELPRLNEDYVKWFMDSNIQHVTLASRDDGLFVAVNGQLLPAVWWDEASMESLLDVLGQFERDGETAYLVDSATMRQLEQLLPILPSLGFRVDFRFPVAEGQEPIPAPDDDSFAEAFEHEGATGTALQTIALTVQYEELPDDQGWVPSLSGFSTVDLNELLQVAGVSQANRYRLNRDLEARLEKESIEDLGVQLRSDGLFVTVDGQLLPHLAWSEDTLANISVVLGQLYPDPELIPPSARWVPVVRALAPLLNDLDVSLAVTFPMDGDGAADDAASMDSGATDDGDRSADQPADDEDEPAATDDANASGGEVQGGDNNASGNTGNDNDSGDDDV